MKKLILFKKFGDSNVAHLYEHAYSLNIINLMSEAGLLDRLDYKLEAETFESGLIKVVAYLQATDAIKMEDTIVTAMVNNRDLEAATISIEMEEGKKLKIDQDMLKTSIQELNKSKWTQEKDIETQQIEDLTKQSGVVLITDIDSERSILRIKVASEIKKDLIPLQYFANLILQFSIECQLGKSGTYFKNSQHSLKGEVLSNVFNYYGPNSLKLDEISESISEVVSQINSPDFYEKIEQFIKDRSNQEITSELNEDVFHVSGILVGNKGWDKMLSIENFERCLNSCSIEIGLHGQKAIITLKNA